MSIAADELLKTLHKKVDELERRVCELEKNPPLQDWADAKVDKRTKEYRESIGR